MASKYSAAVAIYMVTYDLNLLLRKKVYEVSIRKTAEETTKYNLKKISLISSCRTLSAIPAGTRINII